MTDATITVVSGDWLESDPGQGPEPYVCGYEAAALRDPWSGGANPLVSKRVAEAIVADQGDGLERLRWDGDAIVLTDEDGADVSRVEPDRLGLYDVGFGWSWSVVERAECGVIVRDDGTRAADGEAFADLSYRDQHARITAALRQQPGLDVESWDTGGGCIVEAVVISREGGSAVTYGGEPADPAKGQPTHQATRYLGVTWEGDWMVFLYAENGGDELYDGVEIGIDVDPNDVDAMAAEVARHARDEMLGEPDVSTPDAARAALVLAANICGGGFHPDDGVGDLVLIGREDELLLFELTAEKIEAIIDAVADFGIDACAVIVDHEKTLDQERTAAS